MNRPRKDRPLALRETMPRTRLLARAFAASVVLLAASCGGGSNMRLERPEWYARAGSLDPALFDLRVEAGPPPELRFLAVSVDTLDVDQMTLEVEGVDGQDPIAVPVVVDDTQEGLPPPTMIVNGHVGESDMPSQLGLADLIEALLNHYVSIVTTDGHGVRRGWKFQACSTCFPPAWP